MCHFLFHYVLRCNVLYCTVLLSTVLYNSVLCCAVLYCAVYCTVLYWMFDRHGLHCTSPHHTTEHWTTWLYISTMSDEAFYMVYYVMWCTMVCVECAIVCVYYGVVCVVCVLCVCTIVCVCVVLCRQWFCLPHTVTGSRLVSECEDRHKYNTRTRKESSVHINIMEQIRGEQTWYKDR